jgi:uncharacterized membrane protein YeaQ/YmgE (transglycosylase-associated protein family)
VPTEGRKAEHAHTLGHHRCASWLRRQADRTVAQQLILTTVLGIVGSIVASYLGQAVGLYGPDQGAGFIGAIIGAVIILAIWHFIERQRQPY